ncbi:DUF1573 domain-containing protein [Haloferula sp. BvORR071]|uniref:DUF1573 domain-containing protein n=1 Tax=Haloferula sp. BvORR071 TaxID=1396141 RepID=UPI002240FD2A|nr:DUF1573 domain-containing protein [Haloferula sp. BvORR071]
MILALFLAAALPLAAGTLTFESTTLSVDVPFEATSAHVDLKFENKGDKPVVIDHYKSECECLSGEIKGGMLIEPGKGGVIRLSMDTTALTGVVEKKMGLWLQGDPAIAPSHVLTMVAKIPELVSLEPKALIWEIGEKPEPKKAIVTMSGDRPTKITKVSGADPKFAQEWKTLEEGKKYEITVTPAQTATASNGVVRIETDSPYKKQANRNLFTLVKPPAVGAAPKK